MTTDPGEMQLWLYEASDGRKVFVDEMLEIHRQWPGVPGLLKAACLSVARGETVGKSLSGHPGLWEVCIKFRRMEFRVLYAHYAVGETAGTVMLALLPFRKNTTKTPLSAIKTAKARLADFGRTTP